MGALTIPGPLLYEPLEEVRYRIDRGLRIAEEAAKEAARAASDPGQVIDKLRGRYREALRQGILDGKEDVDVLLLSFELEAQLGRKINPICYTPAEFERRLAAGGSAASWWAAEWWIALRASALRPCSASGSPARPRISTARSGSSCWWAWRLRTAS